MTDAPLPLPQIIQAAVRMFPAVVPHLSEQTRNALKQQASYDGIRATWWLVVYDAVYEYLTSDRPVTSFANAMKRGVAEAFFPAAEVAYVEAGAELPMDDETTAWLVGEQNKELQFIDELFARLKEEWEGIDPEKEALARAEGYASTLDGIFAEAKMRGSENITLEFGGDSGKESCGTCQGLMGKRHTIKYILTHDLIPRPGNDSFECGGWQCAHGWFNPKTGEEFKSVKELQRVLKSCQ